MTHFDNPTFVGRLPDDDAYIRKESAKADKCPHFGDGQCKKVQVRVAVVDGLEVLKLLIAE